MGRPSPLQVQRKRQQTGATGATGANSVDRQAQANQRNQVANSKLLFDEIENLIPGGVEEGSATEKEIRKAIDAFLKSDVKKTTEILELVATAEKDKSDFPPQELLVAGMWFASKNPQRGLLMLEKTAVENPNYPGIFSAFARLAISQNRLTDALALLEKADRLLKSEEFSEVEKNHFRNIYLDAMMDLSMRRENYKMAREFANRCQELEPDTPKVLLTLAELEFQEGKIKSSREYLTKLKEVFPTARVPELILAGWYERKSDADNTEKYVRMAAESYPDDQTVQLQFADFSIEREEFKNAQSALEKIERARGENRFTLALKAKIAFANEAYGLAQTHYEKLVKLAPRDANLINLYALSLAESENEEEKKKAYSIALQRYQQAPNSPLSIASLGWISWKLDNKQQAQQLLQRAAQTPRLAPEVAFFLATTLHSQEKSQQAKLILAPALESKKFFFYRNAAKRLMKEIDASSLPAPKK